MLPREQILLFPFSLSLRFLRENNRRGRAEISIFRSRDETARALRKVCRRTQSISLAVSTNFVTNYVSFELERDRCGAHCRHGNYLDPFESHVSGLFAGMRRETATPAIFRASALKTPLIDARRILRFAQTRFGLVNLRQVLKSYSGCAANVKCAFPILKLRQRYT